jgi:uncharacterized membrane protein
LPHLALAAAYLNLFAAGLLAGEEFIIRFGVRGPLGRMAPGPQIELRRGLILAMRVLVPSIFATALLSGVAAAALGGGGMELWLRCGGIAALVTFIAVTLGGTAPINKAALTWDAAAPPPQWRAMVARWEQLDTVRTLAAIAAFALFLAASMLR